MSEVFVRFVDAVQDEDGRRYRAQACGGQMADDDTRWEGWVEFFPEDGAALLRSGRETTQPSREHAEYWATGLTPVYLEGALRRARDAAPVR